VIQMARLKKRRSVIPKRRVLPARKKMAITQNWTTSTAAIRAFVKPAARTNVRGVRVVEDAFSLKAMRSNGFAGFMFGLPRFRVRLPSLIFLGIMDFGKSLVPADEVLRIDLKDETLQVEGNLALIKIRPM
jgi:hypothetical protein